MMYIVWFMRIIHFFVLYIHTYCSYIVYIHIDIHVDVHILHIDDVYNMCCVVLHHKDPNPNSIPNPNPGCCCSPITKACDEIRLSVELVTVGFLRICRHSCCD